MSDTPENDPAWERNIIEKLALETLAEQKRRRRWGIFFKLLGFAYLTFLIVVLGDWGDTAEKLGEGKKHTALVQLNGVIKPTGEASAEKITEALQAAFKDQGTQGVILRINSPGGSPVQSGIINDEIRRLRGQASRHSALCRGRGCLRLGRLLRRGGRRQDLSWTRPASSARSAC
jgi:protease-4